MYNIYPIVKVTEMPRHCTKFAKGIIIQLRNEGLSISQITNEVGRTPITIRKWLLRFAEDGGPGVKTWAKSGRNRTNTTQQDETMVEVSYFAAWIFSL